MKKRLLIIFISLFTLISVVHFVYKKNTNDFDQNITDNYKKLNILDISQAKESPKEGWCGEATIQMALLYMGTYIPQNIINELPNPKNPDIQAFDVDNALDLLNIEYEEWNKNFTIPNVINVVLHSPLNNYQSEIDRFYNWYKFQINNDYPVFLGVRYSYKQDPNSLLEHFVLGVGYSDDKLYINPNERYRRTIMINLSPTELSKYTLHNSYDYIFAYSIKNINGKNREVLPKINIVTYLDNDNIKLRIEKREIISKKLLKKIYKYDKGNNINLVKTIDINYSENLIDIINSDEIITYEFDI